MKHSDNSHTRSKTEVEAKALDGLGIRISLDLGLIHQAVLDFMNLPDTATVTEKVRSLAYVSALCRLMERELNKSISHENELGGRQAMSNVEINRKPVSREVDGTIDIQKAKAKESA